MHEKYCSAVGLIDFAPMNIIRMRLVTLFDKLAGRVPSPPNLGSKIDL